MRGAIYAGRELLVLGFVKQPKGMRLVAKIATKHRERSLRDKPELIAGDDAELHRRLQAHPAVQRLVSGARARQRRARHARASTEVREHSIVTADGRELEVDALVFGTGFHVVDMPVGKLVRGRDGRALEDVWDGSPRAHLGSTVPGFPNFFIMLGPNTGLGHNSMIYMIESQIAYVMDALRELREQRRGHRRGPAGGRGPPPRGGPATHAGHGLEHGLHELVPGREGQQPDAVARLDVAVPAPHGALQPGRVRDRVTR